MDIHALRTANPNPSVHAGIATRNRAHILRKALDSLRLVARPGLAVTVLDDASTDGTSTLASDYPEFRWLRHEQARGIIESRNELMQATPADYFLCLDDDAWFVKGDELALSLERMQSDTRIAAIAFDILSPDRPVPAPRGAPQAVSLFIGCGHLLRLSAVRQAGYYAPTPGYYGSEEKDLCLRLLDLGHRIERLPGVHVWHDKAWAGRDFFPIHKSGVCNELAVTLRRCPWPDLLVLLPLKLLSFLWFWIRHPSFFLPGMAGVGQFLNQSILVYRTRRPVARSTFWGF